MQGKSSNHRLWKEPTVDFIKVVDNSNRPDYNAAKVKELLEKSRAASPDPDRFKGTMTVYDEGRNPGYILGFDNAGLAEVLWKHLTGKLGLKLKHFDSLDAARGRGRAKVPTPTVEDPIPEATPPTDQPESPGEARAQDRGVIFIGVLARDFSVPNARGAMQAVAMQFANLGDGKAVIHAGVKQYDRGEPYWVGFNVWEAGIAFSSILLANRVKFEHAKTLPDGGRPRLALVDITGPEPELNRRPSSKEVRESVDGYRKAQAVLSRLKRPQLPAWATRARNAGGGLLRRKKA